MPVTIQGLEELNRRLVALERVAHRGILQKALLEAGEITRTEAKGRAPVRTGALAADIFVGPSKIGTDLYESRVEVGTGKDVFYGYFQEFGTGTGFQAAAARALGYPGRSRSKSHNQKAHPFLVPAVKATEARRMAAIEAVIEREILKVANL